jgi:hypothetical protein
MRGPKSPDPSLDPYLDLALGSNTSGRSGKVSRHWCSTFDDSILTGAPSGDFGSKEVASFEKGQRQLENLRFTGFEFKFLSAVRCRAARSELLFF